MRYKILIERNLETAQQLISSTLKSVANPMVAPEDNIKLLERALVKVKEALEKVELEHDDRWI
tara:strand:- start:59841 stop:60029 length:189 start_codon:yes stop_codon:yes gene_type:complete